MRMLLSFQWSRKKGSSKYKGAKGSTGCFRLVAFLSPCFRNWFGCWHRGFSATSSLLRVFLCLTCFTTHCFTAQCFSAQHNVPLHDLVHHSVFCTIIFCTMRTAVACFSPKTTELSPTSCFFRGKRRRSRRPQRAGETTKALTKDASRKHRESEKAEAEPEAGS